MARISRSASRLFLAATAVGAVLSIGACDTNVCPDTASGTGCLTANRRDLAAFSAPLPGPEGGQLTSLIPASEAACSFFGPGLTANPDAVYSANGPTAWLWAGPNVAGAAWTGLSPARLGLAGSRVSAGRCAAGKLLVGTDKGLEWISLSDRSTGIFSAPAWGYGVTAIVPVDAGHVLAGVAAPSNAPTFARILSCDIATTSCIPSTTGIPAASVTAQAVLGIASTSAGHLVAALVRDGVYASGDGGQSWTKASGLPASSFPGDVTFSAPAGNGTGLFVSTNRGVYKMGASETQWTFSGPTASGSPIATTAVAVQGTTIYASGLSGALGSVVYKSTNAGGTWSEAAKTIPANVGALALTPNYLWASGTGGVYRSADGGSTWETFNAGLNNVQIFKVVASGGSAFATTASGPSGFYRSTDGCLSWTPNPLSSISSLSLGGRIFQAIAVSGSSVVVAGAPGLYRSSDGGATLTFVGAPKTFLGLAAVGSNFLAVTLGPPFALYRSTDSGSTWAPYGTGFPTTSAGFTPALAVNGNTVIVSVNAAVARSLDGGATWALGGAAPGVTAFAGLAFGGSTLWGAVTYGTASGVFRSDDNGATWTRSANGPSAVRDVAISGTRVLAGTADGAFVSDDGGTTWTRFHDELAGVDVYSVAVSGGTACLGTVSNSVLALPFAATVKRLVPVVLDVAGLARYTTELTLTNRGSTDSHMTFLYTASLGSGTGSATETLLSGSNRVIPDVIAYLRGKGLQIPNDGSGQAGTLLVTFDGLSDPDVASAIARTTAATLAPQPVGAAGLAYSGVDPESGSQASLTVYGLRSSATDRSNLAVYNTTSDPLTFSVTAFSGDGTGAKAVVTAGTILPAWGWTQFNRILDGAGFTNGWVTVARTSTTGAFGTYGVINDNATNDGSFVVAAPGDARPLFLNVPVLVETSAFVSELVLTNSSTKPADFQIQYHEALSPGGPGNQGIVIAVPAGTQRIIPAAVDWLRSMNIAVGPRGAASYAGGLNVYVTSGGGVGHVYAGARTASPSPAGGQYGLFTPAAFAGDEATTTATIYGLHADADNRSNVAAINTAQDAAAGPITLSLTVFDGDSGGAPHGPYALTLAPGQWGQISGVLATAGVSNGWVRISRTAGTAPWIAYGVVNDGGAPGQRTGDGAYVPMERP